MYTKLQENKFKRKIIEKCEFSLIEFILKIILKIPLFIASSLICSSGTLGWKASKKNIEILKIKFRKR